MRAWAFLGPCTAPGHCSEVCQSRPRSVLILRCLWRHPRHSSLRYRGPVVPSQRVGRCYRPANDRASAHATRTPRKQGRGGREDAPVTPATRRPVRCNRSWAPAAGVSPCGSNGGSPVSSITRLYHRHSHPNLSPRFLGLTLVRTPVMVKMRCVFVSLRHLLLTSTTVQFLEVSQSRKSTRRAAGSLGEQDSR